MGLIDPNEGTLKIIPRPGEVRNPLGTNSHRTTIRNREIQAMLRVEGNKPCEIEGYEGWTQLQFAVHMLFLRFMAGEKAATKMVADRMWGRVPFSVELEVSNKDALSELTDEQLLAHFDAVRAQIVGAPCEPER